MARRSGTFSLLWRLGVVALVAGALAWWILGQRREPRVPRSVEPPQDEEVAPAAPEPQWTPRERREPAPGCEPRTERTCVGGDSWWVDSCGEINEVAEDCGLRLCVDGQCEEAEGCGELRPPGRCDGDVAQVCPGGRVIEIDCAADERRCYMEPDGPVCIDPPDEECDWPEGATRCEADVLVTCRRGGIERADCTALNASCVALGPVARCVAKVPPSAATDGCGPCGCRDEVDGEEICDGRDNDGDGWIDEDGCEPIDIVAFVIADRSGEMSYTTEDLEAELQRINAAFSREDDYGLEFRITHKVKLREPDYLYLDETEFDELADSLSYPNDGFYIPMLFTEVVDVGGVPRPGVSTVPNGSCGGVRRDRAWYPEDGLVAIAKRRWPTTGAHEIGHYLGLCHTHGDHPAAVQQVAVVEGEEVSCGGDCAAEVDGICDTPPDPGKGTCSVNAECRVDCPSGETPDARNLMSYYVECRGIFSEQQMLLMRRSLALRRRWQQCASVEGCACTAGAGDCPPQMSCRSMTTAQGEEVWRCGMDGASLPGGTCKDPRDCGDESLCMQVPGGLSLCVRPCNDETPACTCTELSGNPWPICIEDTTRALPSG